jgi:hypothetical protein
MKRWVCGLSALLLSGLGTLLMLGLKGGIALLFFAGSILLLIMATRGKKAT